MRRWGGYIHDHPLQACYRRARGVPSLSMKIIDELSPRSAHEHRIRRRALPLQTEITARRRAIVMVAMALGAFAIGTTEFVSMGLLPLIADDFGISEENASTLITIYAMGVVVGAPLIAAFTGKLPRRRLILLLIGFLVVGNLFARRWSPAWARASRSSRRCRVKTATRWSACAKAA